MVVNLALSRYNDGNIDWNISSSFLLRLSNRMRYDSIEMWKWILHLHLWVTRSLSYKGINSSKKGSRFDTVWMHRYRYRGVKDRGLCCYSVLWFVICDCGGESESVCNFQKWLFVICDWCFDVTCTAITYACLCSTEDLNFRWLV